MIHLFLTVDLAKYVAECLPEDDPIRTGLAEMIAKEEIVPCDEVPALQMYRHGAWAFEVYDEAHAQRIEEVINAPWLWPALLKESKRRSRRGHGEEAAQ